MDGQVKIFKKQQITSLTQTYRPSAQILGPACLLLWPSYSTHGHGVRPAISGKKRYQMCRLMALLSRYIRHGGKGGDGKWTQPVLWMWWRLQKLQSKFVGEADVCTELADWRSWHATWEWVKVWAESRREIVRCNVKENGPVQHWGPNWSPWKGIEFLSQRNAGV